MALTLGLASGAQAHKVNVFAYLENGHIKGEGYFPSGDKAQNSLVELVDNQGKVVGSTRTDSQGEFALPLPAGATPPLKVVLKASMGHQGDYTLGWGDRDVVDTAGQGAPAVAAATPPSTGQATATTAPAAPVDQGDLDKRLARLLDQRLQPLTAQIAKLEADRGVTLHDVVAGLGYILGLLGLAAYLQNRKRGV